jgi:signal peptidase I
LPGDSIAVEEDICIVNGKRNKTRFIKKEGIFDEMEETLPNNLQIKILYQKLMYQNNISGIKIRDDHYFLMGDNRSGQFDSRYLGDVSKENITGKVIEIKKQN